jgi:hypothetical protein
MHYHSISVVIYMYIALSESCALTQVYFGALALCLCEQESQIDEMKEKIHTLLARALTAEDMVRRSKVTNCN